MKRKQTLVYFETDLLNQFDQHIVRPCSRSDALNDILDYLLKNPDVINSFVERRNASMKEIAERNIMAA